LSILVTFLANSRGVFYQILTFLSGLCFCNRLQTAIGWEYLQTIAYSNSVGQQPLPELRTLTFLFSISPQLLCKVPLTTENKPLTIFHLLFKKRLINIEAFQRVLNQSKNIQVTEKSARNCAHIATIIFLTAIGLKTTNSPRMEKEKERR
jgi:hypothetical protein